MFIVDHSIFLHLTVASAAKFTFYFLLAQHNMLLFMPWKKNLTSDKIELLCFYQGGYKSILEGHSERAYPCQAPESTFQLYVNLQVTHYMSA